MAARGDNMEWKMNRTVVLIAFVCGVLASCAPATQRDGEPYEDPVYHTGSRVPTNAGGSTGNAKTLDKSSVDSMMRPPVYLPSSRGN